MDKLDFLAKRLKELRERLNINQSDFADSLGLRKQTYAAYEKTINKPPIDILIKIAEKYNISIDWLCGFTNEETGISALNTYSDVLHLIFELSSVDGLEIDSGFCMAEDCPYGPQINNQYENFMMLYFDDTVINDALKDWKKMLDLLKEGLIDQEVFDLWKEKMLNKYNSYYSTANRNVRPQNKIENIPEDSEIPFK